MVALDGRTTVVLGSVTQPPSGGFIPGAISYESRSLQILQYEAPFSKVDHAFNLAYLRTTGFGNEARVGVGTLDFARRMACLTADRKAAVSATDTTSTGSMSM